MPNVAHSDLAHICVQQWSTDHEDGSSGGVADGEGRRDLGPAQVHAGQDGTTLTSTIKANKACVAPGPG